MHDGALTGFDFGTGLWMGRLAGFSPEGLPLVAGPEGTVVGARTLVDLWPSDIGAELALGQLGGPEGTPLVLGLIRPSARMVAVDDDPVRVIEARERLELRCGPASLTLFADGRVEIRGAQILSRAEGAQRLQGASIHLN